MKSLEFLRLGDFFYVLTFLIAQVNQFNCCMNMRVGLNADMCVEVNAACMPAASLVTKTKCDLWREMKTINGIFALVVYV